MEKDAIRLPQIARYPCERRRSPAERGDPIALSLGGLTRYRQAAPPGRLRGHPIHPLELSTWQLVQTSSASSVRWLRSLRAQSRMLDAVTYMCRVPGLETSRTCLALPSTDSVGRVMPMIVAACLSEISFSPATGPTPPPL